MKTVSEKWRFLWEVQNFSGKAVWPKNVGYIAEFLSYDTLAMEGTDENRANRVLHWISPEKPPKEDKALIARWGHVRAPMELGDYKLTVLVYPTAYPGRDEAGFWGKSSPVFSVPLKVIAAEPGKEPVVPTIGQRGVATKLERTFRRQAFGRPSKELTAKEKK